MKRFYRGLILISAVWILLLCGASALGEDALMGSLKQLGYDRDSLFKTSPLISGVRVTDGQLRFTAGPADDLTALEAELVDGEGATVATFSMDDFEFSGDEIILKDDRIKKDLSFDITARNSAGSSECPGDPKSASASVEGGKVQLYANGSVAVTDPEDRSLVYGKNGMLSEYSFEDEFGLSYTFSGEGNLKSMTGSVPGISGTVLWRADSGWFLEDGKGERTRLTDEQIEIALPYAKYPPRKTVAYLKQFYPRNTACALGLPLRELDPALTDRWYNVVPVRLDTPGTQTIPLVASNMYFVGTVTVTVRGDWVITDYSYKKYGDLQEHDAMMAWFTSLDQITPDFLQSPESGYSFRRRVSRQKDLNGQSVALLFVLNRVSYSQPYNDRGALLTRYWPDHPRYIAYREQLSAMLDGSKAAQ